MADTALLAPPEPTRSGVLLTGGAVAAATVVLAVVDPNDGGHFPTCPLLALTGLYCPFCGGLRTVHDLAHLDLVGALARNPVLTVGLPLLALWWLLWAQRAFTGRTLLARPGLSVRAGWWVLGGLLVFGVLRNLPGWSWLSPA